MARRFAVSVIFDHGIPDRIDDLLPDGTAITVRGDSGVTVSVEARDEDDACWEVESALSPDGEGTDLFHVDDVQEELGTCRHPRCADDATATVAGTPVCGAHAVEYDEFLAGQR